MEPATIAIFTDSYPPVIDGISVLLKDHIAHLRGLGHRVLVFAPRPPAGNDGSLGSYRDGPDVHRLPSIPYMPYPGYRFMVGGPRWVPRVLREEGVGVVHIMTPFMAGLFGLHAARAGRIPTVGSYGTRLNVLTDYTMLGGLPSLTDWLLQAWVKIIFNRFTVVTAPSCVMAKEIAGYGVSRPVLPLQNGIEVHDGIRWKRPSGEDRVVLYVGRLSYEKQVDTVVRSFPRVAEGVPGVRYVIVGDGPDRCRLEVLARDVGGDGRISFTGFVEPEQVAQHLLGANVLVGPCPFETQGLVVTEALTVGVPVVAARGGAFPEIVHEGRNGFLFAPGDAGDLAMRLLLVLRDGDGGALPDLARETEMARREFDIKEVSRTWSRLYDSVAAVPPPYSERERIRRELRGWAFIN